MYIKKNLNPKNRMTGDCSTRALAAATGLSYNEVLKEQYETAVETAYSITDKETIEKILYKHGFKKKTINRPKRGETRLTVDDVARKTANEDSGFNVALCKVANHVVTCISGCIIDTWDCSESCVYTYYVKKQDGLFEF